MPSALVTGGSSGIGLAIARMLARRGLRADARLAHGREDRSGRCRARRARGRRPTWARKTTASASSPSTRSASAAWTCSSTRRASGSPGTVESLQTKHIDLQLNINLRGLLLVSREAIPLLKESKGWIVNLASIAGTAPTPGLTVYGATKAAVIALTRSQNAELDADGVRAIAICPGFVDTPMAQWSGLAAEEMIQPEDCAEIVRMCLRLSPRARIPQVVVERVGSSDSAA